MVSIFRYSEWFWYLREKKVSPSLFLIKLLSSHCHCAVGPMLSQVQSCLLSTQPVPAARLPCRVKVSAGKRYAWCACGHSKKQVRTSRITGGGVSDTPGAEWQSWLIYHSVSSLLWDQFESCWETICLWRLEILPVCKHWGLSLGLLKVFHTVEVRIIEQWVVCRDLKWYKEENQPRFI